MNFEAHPRSRGENGLTSAGTAVKAGSSPLTRGKHAIPAASATPMRLIPAHAGKTRCSPTSRGRCTAHPRSRGENKLWGDLVKAYNGSSPLTRGKHFSDAHFAASARLIPAHAGKTVSARVSIWTPSAHPRSRGENQAGRRSGRLQLGSSPLTRGKRQKWSVVRIARRLIPAHAGKTRRDAGLAASSWAHPRSRGENPPAVAWKVWLGGSSPLTRGKLTRAAPDVMISRLIPAHAGKTRQRPHHCHPWSAHPRSRGENGQLIQGLFRAEGSSPLTRGKQARLEVPAIVERLIPAHAGKTP